MLFKVWPFSLSCITLFLCVNVLGSSDFMFWIMWCVYLVHLFWKISVLVHKSSLFVNWNWFYNLEIFYICFSFLFLLVYAWPYCSFFLSLAIKLSAILGSWHILICFLICSVSRLCSAYCCVIYMAASLEFPFLFFKVLISILDSMRFLSWFLLSLDFLLRLSGCIL